MSYETFDNLKQKAAEVLQGQAREPGKIEYWDGKTAGRIVNVLRKLDFRSD